MGQGSRIELQTGAYFAIAAGVLILPLWFFLSLIIAACFHEICHYLALKVMGVTVYRIRVGAFGASMETESMDPGRELICALVGPMGSFALVPLFCWIPGIALCGLIQGVFNILPIYPMDGGRILRSLLEILRMPYSDQICRAVEWVIVLGIVGLGFWVEWSFDMGWSGATIGGILLLRIIRRNTSCKESRLGVQ